MVRNLFVILACLALVVSCRNDDEQECRDAIAQRANERTRVEGRRLYVHLTAADTAIFNYPAGKTIRFAVTDSGLQDTVTYSIAQRSLRYLDESESYYDEGCHPEVFAEHLDITFVPDDSAYEVLKFNLAAHEQHTTFNFSYNGNGVEQGMSYLTNYPFADRIAEFPLNGKVFKEVLYLSSDWRKSGKGYAEYFVNSTEQLFLFIIDDKRWFVKID